MLTELPQARGTEVEGRLENTIFRVHLLMARNSAGRCRQASKDKAWPLSAQSTHTCERTTKRR